MVEFALDQTFVGVKQDGQDTTAQQVSKTLDMYVG